MWEAADELIKPPELLVSLCTAAQTRSGGLPARRRAHASLNNIACWVLSLAIFQCARGESISERACFGARPRFDRRPIGFGRALVVKLRYHTLAGLGSWTEGVFALLLTCV